MWPPIIGTLSGILKKWLREEDPRAGTRAIQQGIHELREAIVEIKRNMATKDDINTHNDHIILLINAIQSDHQHQNSRMAKFTEYVNLHAGGEKLYVRTVLMIP